MGLFGRFAEWAMPTGGYRYSGHPTVVIQNIVRVRKPAEESPPDRWQATVAASVVRLFKNGRCVAVRSGKGWRRTRHKLSIDNYTPRRAVVYQDDAEVLKLRTAAEASGVIHERSA